MWNSWVLRNSTISRVEDNGNDAAHILEAKKHETLGAYVALEVS